MKTSEAVSMVKTAAALRTGTWSYAATADGSDSSAASACVSSLPASISAVGRIATAVPAHADREQQGRDSRGSADADSEQPERPMNTVSRAQHTVWGPV